MADFSKAQVHTLASLFILTYSGVSIKLTAVSLPNCKNTIGLIYLFFE
jgi:hypothetical protein